MIPGRPQHNYTYPNDYRRRGQLSAHTQQDTIKTVGKHTRTHKQIRSNSLLIALFTIITRGNYKNLGQLGFNSAQETFQLLDGSLEGFWDDRNTTIQNLHDDRNMTRRQTTHTTSHDHRSGEETQSTSTFILSNPAVIVFISIG